MMYLIILKPDKKLKILQLKLPDNFNKEYLNFVIKSKVKEPDKLLGITDDFDTVKINVFNINKDI